jgi:hypothetical protein
MNESLLLAAVPVATFDGPRLLTRASGFFFARDERLFLVTSRHVMIDEPSRHWPDRIEVVLHLDPTDLTRSTGYGAMLYRDGRANWRQGRDSGGEIDVAVLEIDRHALPAEAVLQAFTPDHLAAPSQDIQVGTPLLIVGFPMGFHDQLHHLPVVRQAVVASAYGVRFQGQGYFLTDARTHRGTSGAPVVMRAADVPDQPPDALPWRLLGVHSGRLDMQPRDAEHDDPLGLNCAWYADILLTLTAEVALASDGDKGAAPSAAGATVAAPSISVSPEVADRR